MKKLALRDYQQSGVDAVVREWKSSISTLGLCATGGGKTCIAAEIIRLAQPKRAIFLCDREELVFQAKNTIQKWTGLECGIEMADSFVNNSLFGELPVVIATVQTLNSKFGDRTRMSRFNPMDFSVCIADEVHKSVAPTWKNVLHYFRQNPELRVLGITATADRHDQQALGQICDTVAFEYDILELMQRGWLVPIEQQFVNISGLDFSEMRTTAGDLNGADLAAVMEAESNLQGVAGATIDIIGKRRTLIFTASVRQAETLSNIFNRHKAGMANWVCGATNKDDRREMLRHFQDGDTQVMVNCNVLSTGFDNPSVEVIVQARPTKSRQLYTQQIGRSTRPLPGVVDGPETAELRRASIAASAKPSALVIDFVGNSGRHKLVTSADILGGKVSDDAVARAVKIAKSKGGAVRMTDVLEDAEDDIRKEAEERRLAEEARKAKLVAKVQYKAKSVSPFDVFDLQPVRERGWDNGRVLSEKQRSFLLRAGINPDTMKYVEAKVMLNEMFRRMDGHLCSYKQAALLKKHGYETKDMTMNDATKLISALANNGWKRPATEAVAASQPQDDNVPF